MTTTSSRNKLRGAEWTCTKSALSFGFFWKSLKEETKL